MNGKILSIRQIADVVFDLVYHGRFPYNDVIDMPLFQRNDYHQKLCKALEDETKFRLALHDKKQG